MLRPCCLRLGRGASRTLGGRAYIRKMLPPCFNCLEGFFFYTRLGDAKKKITQLIEFRCLKDYLLLSTVLQCLTNCAST